MASCPPVRPPVLHAICLDTFCFFKVEAGTVEDLNQQAQNHADVTGHVVHLNADVTPKALLELERVDRSAAALRGFLEDDDDRGPIDPDEGARG